MFVKALGDIYAGLSMYIKQLLEAVKYFSIIRVCKHKNQNLDEMIWVKKNERKLSKDSYKIVQDFK